MIDEETIDNLDTSWIDEFNLLDNEYKNYYKEDLTFIKLHGIYLNSEYEIEKLTEEKILLKTPNLLSKLELISIIKKYSFSNNVKYSLMSILKYNIDLEPYELKKFLKQNNTSNYLFINKNIDDIKFEKSISLFHDINDIILIFYKNISPICEKECYKQNVTKKIFIKDNNINRKTRRK